MTVKVRKIWIMTGIAAVLVLLAYAWIDGGREPVRELTMDLAVPGERR